MQITLLRDDEHTVGLDEQSLGDQCNRHFREARENLMQQGGYGTEVINDDDSNTHIGGQMPQ
jgi:hypothetical protein